MSKRGKVLFLASAAFFVSLFVFRILYMGWHESMWVPLILGLALFVAATVIERRAFADFFTMRTTKHGMNMGALIVVTLAGLACLNVLAVRYEHKWDWTGDKLYSLSDQALKAAHALNEETEILLLYRPGEPNTDEIQRQAKDVVDLFKQESNKIRYVVSNALQNPSLAKMYEFNFGAFAMFASQGGRRVKIDQPTEEGVTRALLRFGREQKKVLYFITGHGERDLGAKDNDGLSLLNEELAVTYDVKPLRLIDVGNKVPEDAGAVAIVRPLQQYLEVELQALRDYAKRGGHLFIAIDPGIKHNLAQLTKTFGVEFRNDYVLDVRPNVAQMALGTVFSAENEITKAFGELNAFTVFDQVSTLSFAKDAAPSLKMEQLVATDDQTMRVDVLGGEVKFAPNGPHLVGAAVTGALPGEGSKPFDAIIFGDSDFVANRIIQNNLNRDLVMNSFASLMADKDLISIRPKRAGATTVNMMQGQLDILGLLFFVPLPILFFFGGGFWWWRRRTA